MTTAQSRANLLTGFGLAAGCLLLACLLSRGTTGGDEGDVLGYLAYYQLHGWTALRDHFGDNVFLAHRLFWLCEKIVWSMLLQPAAMMVSHSRMAVNYLLVLDGSLLMIGAFVLAVLHLRGRGLSASVALLAPSALMIASSAIGLFTGGFSECAMCLLVMILMALLDRPQISLAGLCAFFTCGFLLIAAKIYATPFALVLALLLPASRRTRLVMAALIIAAPFVWLGIETYAQSATNGGVIKLYGAYAKQRDIVTLAGNGIAFFLSWSYGLLPCFPLVLFAAFCPRSAHRSLSIKVFAILGVTAMLLTIPFWAGPGGLGGPRYIIPFLMILIPEIALGMTVVAKRQRGALLLVPLMALFFLPTLEYRNSLLIRYARPFLAEQSLTAMPHTDPALHPAVFAWRVAAAKRRHVPQISTGFPPDVPLPVAGIFPMTSLSRSLYVLSQGRSGPPEIQPVYLFLVKHHLDASGIIRTSGYLLVIGLLGLLTVAALRPGLRQP